MKIEFLEIAIYKHYLPNQPWPTIGQPALTEVASQHIKIFEVKQSSSIHDSHCTTILPGADKDVWLTFLQQCFFYSVEINDSEANLLLQISTVV